MVDLSTGEFAATEASGWAALGDELQRLEPSEIVLPAGLAGDTAWTTQLNGQRPARLSAVPDDEASPAAGPFPGGFARTG